MRTYKRTTSDGVTSLSNMNAAVTEVLVEGKKCRTVAKAHNVSESTLRRYSKMFRFTFTGNTHI